MRKNNFKIPLILGVFLSIYSCSEDLGVENETNANSLISKNSIYARSADLLYDIKGETIDALPKTSELKSGFYIISKHSYRALTKVEKGKQIEQTEYVFPDSEYIAPSTKADITINFEGVVNGTPVYRIQWGKYFSTTDNSFWEISSKDGGAPVTTQASKLGNSQRFVFEPTGDPDNSVYIRNLDTGKYLQISGNAEVNIKSGAVVEQQSLFKSQGQKFLILSTNTGTEDKYLNYKGQSAVQVNGQIWMRNILGDNRTTPDQGPYDQYNYYQQGRKVAVSNASTGSGAISNWSVVSAPANAWNLGTELSPIKNVQNDPCPSGYRVPSHHEFETLIESTTGHKFAMGYVAGFVGEWTSFEFPNNKPTNYSAARVLKSRNDSNIKLTFPATGIRQWDDGKLYSRGYQGNYWTSSSFGYGTGRYLSIGKTGNMVVELGATNAAYPIRCIAEK